MPGIVDVAKKMAEGAKTPDPAAVKAIGDALHKVPEERQEEFLAVYITARQAGADMAEGLEIAAEVMSEDEAEPAPEASTESSAVATPERVGGGTAT